MLGGTYSVLVRNVVAVEDVEDDDEHEEVVADMKGLLPEAGAAGLRDLEVRHCGTMRHHSSLMAAQMPRFKP